jgi:hypothetical protein
MPFEMLYFLLKSFIMLVFAALFVGYSSEWSSENNHRP